MTGSRNEWISQWIFEELQEKTNMNDTINKWMQERTHEKWIKIMTESMKNERMTDYLPELTDERTPATSPNPPVWSDSRTLWSPCPREPVWWRVSSPGQYSRARCRSSRRMSAAGRTGPRSRHWTERRHLMREGGGGISVTPLGMFWGSCLGEIDRRLLDMIVGWLWVKLPYGLMTSCHCYPHLSKMITLPL